MITINGSIKSQSVNVSSVATKIPTTNMNNRTTMLIRNNGSETVELGGAGVTFGQGIPLKAGESLPFAIKAGAQLYGITQASDVDVRVMEAL